MLEEEGHNHLPRFLKIWIGLEVARHIAGLLLYPQPTLWGREAFYLVISVLLVFGMSKHSRGARAIALFFAGMAAFFGLTQLPQYPIGSQESWWRISIAVPAGIQIVVLLTKESRSWFDPSD